MDLDAFVAAHSAEWARLDDLVRRRRRLDGAEVDELVDLYERVSTHLSQARSSSPDPALVARLSGSVQRARSALTAAQTPAWRDLARFFAVSFPVTAYRARWWWLGASLGSLVVALVAGWWVATHPEVQAAIAPPAEIKQLVENDFANYYTEHPAASFMLRVWTNNAWVAAQSLIFGILLGIPTIGVLYSNAVNVGVSGGLMVAHGKGDIFFGLITPHGLLELTAVFLAAAVGLRLGWTIIDPGRRPRGQALAQEGRAAMSIVLGGIVVLFISGLIEGFVTGYVHTTWLRVGIGVVAEVLFLTYVIVLGRRGVRAGETGDIRDRPATAPVSA
ncbi:MAG: stage II sporulation protein M [Streptosporangiales bacterium]|nr:stage II sporulation protein M [Streptosporangiales bacterium]